MSRPTREQVELARAVCEAPAGQLPPFLVIAAAEILHREEQYEEKSLRTRLWPLAERLFWRRVGPLLYTFTAAWCAFCAWDQGCSGWTITYGSLTLLFFGLWLWGGEK